MCYLQIHMQGHGGIFEVLPAEAGNAEFAVEEAVGLVLLKLFGEGIVDEVSLHFFSSLQANQRHCSIQIRAQCSYESFTLLPRTKEHIELAVEMHVSAILRELFGSVNVESVVLTICSAESRKQTSSSR